MEKARLIISDHQGGASIEGRCSVCYEIFAVTGASIADPMLEQRDLRDVFDNHVRDRHSWRADANRSAALRLRKMMEEFEG